MKSPSEGLANGSNGGSFGFFGRLDFGLLARAGENRI